MYSPFYLKNFADMKFTTETAYQRNSSETAQQNLIKLCSFKGHNVLMCTFSENSDSIIFRGVRPILNLEILLKLHILLKQFVSGTPLNPPNRIT